jgi:hypothetical protein
MPPKVSTPNIYMNVGFFFFRIAAACRLFCAPEEEYWE